MEGEGREKHVGKESAVGEAQAQAQAPGTAKRRGIYGVKSSQESSAAPYHPPSSSLLRASVTCPPTQLSSPGFLHLSCFYAFSLYSHSHSLHIQMSSIFIYIYIYGLMMGTIERKTHKNEIIGQLGTFNLYTTR